MKNTKDGFELLGSSKISYKDLQSSFLPNQTEDTHCLIQALWRAVITQALMDAGSNSNKIELKKEKARATAWLFSDGEDFEEVCIMAGFTPEYVRSKAARAIKNGCKWRKETSIFLKTERRKPKQEDVPKNQILSCAFL